MKKLIILFAIAILIGCTNEPVEKNVVFSTNYLTVESGNLKSFDINTWQHFYWPYQVTVTLHNQATGKQYHTSAANSFVFFSEGSEPTYLPLGEYNCSVTGGGWVEGGNAFPWFVWSIKDTLITVTEETNVIRFALANSPALIVKDADAPITIKGVGIDSIAWVGKGSADFVYVTAPWPYVAHSGGKFVNIEAKPGNYYYLQLNTDTTQIGGTVELPVFTGDTVVID